ncbi:MAG TPA: AMP-binding protein [Solirubrobacteraceae bacterium]
MTITTAAARARDATALGAPTLPAAFQRTAAERPREVALRASAWSITWEEYAARVRRIAEGLASLGLGRGDTLALLLTNRPEFNLVDTAAMHLGATPFSLYPVAPAEQIAYVLRDADARVAVTEQALLPRLRESGAELDHVIVVDGPGGTMTLEQLEAAVAPGFDFDAAWRAVAPDDLITLVYTSGTTGPPKGVEHTHSSALAICRAGDDVLGLQRRGRVLSYLSPAHLVDRLFSHWYAMTLGLTSTSCPDPMAVAALLPEVRPTVFVSVPRLWQKLRAVVETAMADDLTAADEAACERIRRRLGLDACTSALAAAAPSQPETLSFFNAIGVPLLDGYGMCEIAPIAAQRRGAAVPGTVGPAAPGVELRLDEDGEILVRGPGLMRGYRNHRDNPVDADGWFRTGDVGALNGDGCLRIVDRKKELIINDAGKNMSPANIEAAITASSPLIGCACVVGDRRPYNVALLTPDPLGAAAFARSQAMMPDDLASPAGRSLLRAEVAAAVEQANARLAPHERIERHLLLSAEWRPGGDELTPTSKLKRRAIAERYADQIERMYS